MAITNIFVARPTLKNRVKLSRRVSKFVGLFVSKMFSSFENCIFQFSFISIIAVFCERFLALLQCFIYVYHYMRHFVLKVTVFKGHNLKPPLMRGGVMFRLAGCWTFLQESQNGGRKRKPKNFYDWPTDQLFRLNFSDLVRTQNGDICDFLLIIFLTQFITSLFCVFNQNHTKCNLPLFFLEIKKQKNMDWVKTINCHK